MRQGAVYMNGKLAGILTEISPTEYVFKYDDTYYADDMQPAVSLTLPKTQQEYRSAYLFPFFSNMLSEGRRVPDAAPRQGAASYFGPVSRPLPRPFHGAGASPALPSGAVLYSECAVFAVVLPASLPVPRRRRESWSAPV